MLEVLVPRGMRVQVSPAATSQAAPSGQPFSKRKGVRPRRTGSDPFFTFPVNYFPLTFVVEFE